LSGLDQEPLVGVVLGDFQNLTPKVKSNNESGLFRRLKALNMDRYLRRA
jgi:hypothetical protein